MNVTRRAFLKYCISAAALLGLETSCSQKLEKILAKGGGGPPIIWLSGANCTGCTISLANLSAPTAPVDAADLLFNTINLAYHTTLMGAAGDLAIQTLRQATTGEFILAVEGAIPTAFGGNTCTLWTEAGKEMTALGAVQDLAPRASAVLCIGTCASFGGISAASPNPTQAKSVKEVTGVETINIAGCPPHPDWIVGTIAQLLAGNLPTLDKLGRPTDYYSKTVHSQCPRIDKQWATQPGLDVLCLNNLGCKGPNTYSDCPNRLWNNKTSWCVGTNGLCLGCTQDKFPDGFSPVFSSIGATPPDCHPITPEACTECHESNPVAVGGMMYGMK